MYVYAIESSRGSLSCRRAQKTLVKNVENIQLLSYYVHPARCTKDIIDRGVSREISFALAFFASIF